MSGFILIFLSSLRCF